MVYNRYIPDSKGTYHQQRVITQEKIPDKPGIQNDVSTEQKTFVRTEERSAIDLGDILLLCIAILLISEADGNDMSSIIIAIAAFMFLQ